MLWEIFVVGTFWFWALLLAEFIFVIFLVENEKYFIAPLSLGATVILIALFGSGIGTTIQWMIANPGMSLAYLAGYFAMGTIFAAAPFGKWWWFVHDVRDHNRKCKKDWLDDWKDKLANAKQNIVRLEKAQDKQPLLEIQAYATALENSKGVMTAELLPFWKEAESQSYYYDMFGRRIAVTKPNPGDYKNRIVAWIVYWPPCLFWTVLNDPLRFLGRLLYESVSGLLSRIADSAWKDEDKI